MITFDKMESRDWKAVKQIYQEGIAAGNTTFHQSAPDWDEWNNNHLQHSRAITKENDDILGWAALTSVSGRCVYAGVAEVSVYESDKAREKGLGKLLLQKLIEESEANNIRTLQARIFPENVASIKIHQSFCFRMIGRRDRIGQMNGVWRDILLFERRSNKVGL